MGRVSDEACFLSLPEELYQYIFCYLSLQERVMLREVCVTFKQHVKDDTLMMYKLDEKISKIYLVEMEMAQDLICYSAYSNFTIFIRNECDRIHPLFQRNNRKNECIISDCREKKLGYIYFSKRQPKPEYHQRINWSIYNKRKIPYCSNCFRKWSI